ncbi:hypothetical protein SPBR_01980 [Sporothrix brasiliensis 5110]|uniref:Uncharacterized protein n=1 Tax=Sporothrix brasiliensis 5110 TaxID=1398154 RepID=A0A0C2EXV4_9PEZI|nr:uncharacterized protein SPBR_01980 [Sporothrix brasiliensis 5110]KIH91514.1 hypothetical protein SPBR_01980 [Sporothrix brasiliensis 5110]
MPSLSILKRSGRDAPPWSLRSWNNPSDNIIETPETTTTRTEIMPVSARSCAGSPTADNIFGSNSRSYERNGADLQGVSIPGPMTTTTSPLSPPKKDRRDSKRDLLHGLISRSIRGAGRALSTSSPSSPPSSQSASTTSLSPLSSSVGSPTSTTATASTAPSLFASPPQTSSPSPFHERKPRTAAPAPQKLYRPRPRQSSAAPAYSGASASNKTHGPARWPPSLGLSTTKARKFLSSQVTLSQ